MWYKQAPLSLRRGVGGEVKMHPASRLLDAGSGFGQYSYFLSGLGKDNQIDAVDVKEEQIADCTEFFSKIQRDNVTFAIADLTTFKKPETYDLILSVDVMEHILEDELVFQNFYHSLKPRRNGADLNTFRPGRL